MKEKNSPPSATKYPGQIPKPQINQADERVIPRVIEPVRTGFRFVDFFVLVFCLSGILFFIFIFRHDLYQSIKLNNVQPVGTVVIKSNVVQRRIADRVLWDRLLNDSSLYAGDIIRVAELSSATLNVVGQHIFLSENTLVRIQRSADGETLSIELSEGNISVSTSEEGGNLQINLMGQIIETSSGSVFNFSVGDDGIVIKSLEGTAVIVNEGGENREIASASMIVIDTEGIERREPSAVVIHPRSNARFIRETAAPVPVSFEWNRINLEPADHLSLEIAEDRNFNNIILTLYDLEDKAVPSLDLGVWHWRLSFHENVFSSGRILIAETFTPEPISPIRNSVIRYQDDLPSMRFQWAEVEEASYYIFEASLLPDFSNIQITQETAATSFVMPEMGQGTWYWRVTPVFPYVFDGGISGSDGSAASSSAVSQFRVEHGIHAVPDENEAGLLPPAPLELRLISPDNRASLAGLTVLRSGALFQWDSGGNAASSRFIISRNSNPMQQPAIEINNPGRTVRINRLDAGTWYWTVEARSAEGFVSSAPPRQIQVLPVPILPPPGNLQPPSGYKIDIEAIKNRQSIDFSWRAVNGANAYIITLFEQDGNSRRQIFRSSPLNGTRWTLEDLSLLSRNTFYWQVEAVNINQNGAAEQSGAPGENFFIVDFPLPEVHAIRPGVLYGQ